MNRPRTVFGRIKTMGYTFEMTKNGIVLRKKHARKTQRISFTEIIDAAAGQKSLPLA